MQIDIQHWLTEPDLKNKSRKKYISLQNMISKSYTSRNLRPYLSSLLEVNRTIDSINLHIKEKNGEISGYQEEMEKKTDKAILREKIGILNGDIVELEETLECELEKKRDIEREIEKYKVTAERALQKLLSQDVLLLRKNLLLLRETSEEIPGCDIGFYMKGFFHEDFKRGCVVYFLNKAKEDFEIVRKEVEFNLGNLKKSEWKVIEDDSFPEYAICVQINSSSPSFKFVQGFSHLISFLIYTDNFRQGGVNSFRQVGECISNLINDIAELHENDIYDSLVSPTHLNRKFEYDHCPLIQFYHEGIFEYTELDQF